MWRLLAYLAGWEGAWYLRRKQNRSRLFAQALAEARRLGRPLVVVGAPDGGMTSSPCGDLTIDLIPAVSCPRWIQADITKKLPLADDSAVVYVSCVLEYVINYAAALAELSRVSGGHLYIVRVQPWTLTAYLYRGAQRTLPANIPGATIG